MCSLIELRIAGGDAGPAEPFASLRPRVEAAGEQPRADSASTNGTGLRRTFCPDFHAAIELIGRRWAGAILWSLPGARTTSPS